MRKSYLFLLAFILSGCTEGVTVIEELTSASGAGLDFNGKSKHVIQVVSENAGVNQIGSCDSSVVAMYMSVESGSFQLASSYPNVNNIDWDCSDGKFTFDVTDIDLVVNFTTVGDKRKVNFRGKTENGDDTDIVTLEIEWTGTPAAPAVNVQLPSVNATLGNVDPTIRVSGIQSGDSVELFSDPGCSASIAGPETSIGTFHDIVRPFGGTNTTLPTYANFTRTGVTSLCSAAVSYQYDDTAPSVTVLLDSNSYATPNLTVQIDLTTNDAVDMYLTNTSGCASGGSWEPYNATTGSWTLGGTNALQTVYVALRDAAGNVSPCVNDAIYHDNLAPTSAPSFDDGSIHTSATSSPVFTWGAAADTLSGISHYEIAIGTTSGASDEVSYTNVGNVGSYQFTGLSLVENMQYFATIRTVDNAGNVSADSLGDGWFVDETNEPPVITVSNCGNTVYESDATLGSFETANSSCTVSHTDPDPGAGVTFAIEGTPTTCGAWININGAGLITGTPAESDQGTCNFEIRADDGTNTEYYSLSVDVQNFCKTPPQSSWTTYNVSGDGSAGTPYQICTPSQYEDIGMNACGGGNTVDCGANFDLRGDIDFSMLGAPHVPIGGVLADAGMGEAFTGDFDGNGYDIINFSLSDPGATNDDYIAPIRRVGSGGSVHDVRFINPTITGYQSVAGAIGISVGTLSNIQVIGGSVTANVAASSQAGGLVGAFNGGTGTNLISSASVTAVNYAGGLVGVVTTGTITNSVSHGSVIAENESGGFAGRVYASGSITDSLSTGDVSWSGSGSGNHLGGFLGYLYNGTLQRVGATGNVDGGASTGTRVGGLVGYANGSGTTTITITDSFAKGNVNVASGFEIGGIVGRLNNSGSNTVNLERNYYSGVLTSSGSEGGVVGLINGGDPGTFSYTNNYYNSAATANAVGSGDTWSAGEGNSLTLASMSVASNYSTWDFGSVWSTNSNTVLPYHQALATVYEPVPASSRYIFITSGTTNGNMGGRVGGESLCNTEASGYLPGTYSPILSETSFQHASTYISVTQMLQLPNGQKVANSSSDLFTNGTNVHILQSADKSFVGTFLNVWSSSQNDGQIKSNLMSNTCNNWTSSSGAQFGGVGLSLATSSWLDGDAFSGCDQQKRIYCIQTGP